MNPSSQTRAPSVGRTACSLASRAAPGILRFLARFLAVLVLVTAATPSTRAASASLLGWNNLGMHCMDSDYSVFSILPPYNTIEAQLIVGGKLVKAGTGYSVTYEAVADPDGSINSTSIGKGNFYDFTAKLYGALSPDQGLAGWGMPGPMNIPQSMLFEPTNQPVPGVFTPVNWFRAEGIPITPYDDAGNKNPYPLLRLVARNSSGQVIARSDIVAPVSDEMDCSACHGSKETFRLNILQSHDTKEFARDAAAYTQALLAMNYRPEGLLPTAQQGQPILCAKCHASEALGTKSYGNIPPLTASMHSMHANVMDPVTSTTLGSVDNRSACYRCHPGSETRCLRGAMGGAVAPDGSMSMQCQSCHGTMEQVGAPTRVGWLMEPNCQGCHTGTATHNNGQIRFTSVFETNGTERVAVDSRFATTPNTPAAGISLYRFSTGHGGLQCSACHGSTHAEFPATHRNDNVRNVQLQGHGGVTAECTACHTTMPSTVNGGPHGMHPIGAAWVESHHDAIEGVGLAACQACHGANNRGTVLSRVQGNRTFQLGDNRGTVTFARGDTVGCYTCHNGPSSDGTNANPAPAITDVSGQTTAGVPLDLVLPVGNASAVLRIVSQPANGTVGLSNNIATYFPADGFTGTESFTFSAYDGAKNSALATGTVTVIPGDASAEAPFIDVNPDSQVVAVGSPATFTVVASGGILSYQWYRNGWPLSGATEASLVLPTVSSADVGTYVVLVTDDVGSTASAPASLSAITAVTITRQPVSQTVISGSSVTFTVAATGSSLITYQWTRNGNPISGATGASLRLTGVTLNSAGNYQARVSNPAGSVLSDIAILTVQAAPAITRQPQSLTVNEGESASFSVTVTGVPTPTFQWSKNSVVIPGATSATLTLPVIASNDAGSYTVRVSNGLGSVTSSAAVLTVRSPAPSVTGFSPALGPVGASVTITGTYLGGASGVRFNGTPANFFVVSPTQITATVPAGATSGTISVTTTGGTATSPTVFTVIPAPSLTGFTPSSGAAGTVVTLDGSGLNYVTAVAFNGAPATFALVSPTQITATVPAGATSGTVSATSPGGVATSASAFTVGLPGPRITSFSPSSGGIGTAVTITGVNLTGATSVRFNGAAAVFTVVGPGTIVAGVPRGATTGRITVTTVTGTATSPSNYSVGSRYAVPTITSLSPSSGPVGTRVVLTGANLGATTSARIGSRTASFTVLSANQVQVVIPSLASSARITLATPGGSVSSSTFTVTR